MQQPIQLQTKMQNSSLPQVWFFLLINTKSGGGWGRSYLELKKHQFSFEYKKQRIINIKLIDLFEKQKKQIQLRTIKKLQLDSQNDIRIIICGGDGTIVWGIQQCCRTELDFQKILFASLPIGTGNDFSRTIGWGSDALKFKQGNILPLKKRIVQWLQADIGYYDVWQVQISVYQNGQIFVVKNKEDYLLDTKMHSLGFVNYVGIGIDARVSYNFEKHRQSTKLMNLAVYGCFGCLYLCKKIPELSDAIETFDETQNYVGIEPNHTPASLIKEPQQMDDSMVENLYQLQHPYINRNTVMKSGYHGLVCLNSISYMAGAMNAWRTDKLGCKKSKNGNEPKFEQQKIDDGKIQFLGYKDQLRLGLQKMIHTGSRIAQGSGPFVIRFKQQLNRSNYIQIDGQGLKLRGIKQIVIKKFQKVKGSRIRVMKNKLK